MTDAYPPFRLDIGGHELMLDGTPPDVIASKPTLKLS
jgi:hypothetical protein